MSATNFVLDIEGTEVRPGDRIAYAVRDGNAAALRVAEVKSLEHFTDWRGNPATSVKVGRTSIQAGLKRFVKLADAACAAGEHVHIALVDSNRDELRDAERRLEDAIAVANAEKVRSTRLREAIEGAPHAATCHYVDLGDGEIVYRQECTCWKALAS